MAKYLLARCVSLVPTLIGISMLVFLVVRLIPGSIVEQMIGMEGQGDPQMLDRLRTFFGLDQPIHVQYLTWAGRVLQGDLGTSWRSGLPVQQLILSRFQVTAELSLLAMLIALAVGLPLGVLSAVRQNTAFDHLVRVISLLSLSIPIFWQAGMLILLLSLTLRWIPPTSYTDPFTDLRANLAVMVLPSAVLGTAVAATIMRMTRSSLLDVLRKDYVRTARGKGLRSRTVITRHALKNALVPVITVAGVQVGYLLGGAVVAEEVFTLPGVGRLVLQAVANRDYPVVQGAVLCIALLFALSNLVVDVAYHYLDPRLRRA